MESGWKPTEDDKKYVAFVTTSHTVAHIYSLFRKHCPLDQEPKKLAATLKNVLEQVKVG